MKKIFTFIMLLLLVSCQHRKETGTFIIIETQFGDIHAQLFPEKAPKTVAAFLSYIDSGWYKKSSFYRVLKEQNQPMNSFRPEIIQGGIYKSDYTREVKLPGIPLETTFRSKLSHTDGALSLARTTPGSGSTEFFICLGNQPSFDSGADSNPDKLGYAAFGKVIKGMNVVRKIHEQPENGEDFDPPVQIINIRRD